MQRSDIALAPLQEWMQQLVTHPGDLDEYASSRAAALRVDDVILPSRTLQPVQRIGIYHGMYLARMIEALAADYGALACYLGDDVFETLVRNYVEAFPSRGYTLNRLGDSLPEYLASAPLEGLGGAIFLRDLARLELAMTHVFDEAESEPMPGDAINSLPAHRIADARLVPIPALRLLSLDYDANEAFQAFRDERPIKPRRKRTWLAVHRRDYGVFRMPLTFDAFSILESLAEGLTIGSAITNFHHRYRRLPEQAELFTWFRDWSAAGLFAGIEIT